MKPGNLRSASYEKVPNLRQGFTPWTIRVKGAAFEIMPFLMCIYVSEGLFYLH